MGKDVTNKAMRPLSERLASLLKRLKAAYPLMVMEEGTAREYKRVLTDMVGEFGYERTEKAVDRAIDGCEFFPTAKALRDHVPIATKTKSESDPNCQRCGGSGWRQQSETDRRVVRCECRRIVEVAM